MLKKILLSMGILSIGALCVYAATSGSQYVYYGTNKSKPSKPYSQPYTSPISKTNTQTTTQINQSEYPIYNYTNAEEPVITTTVGQLPAGSYIIDKDSLWKYREDVNYSGKVIAEVPVVWQKLEDNHYAKGTTLLLSKYDVAIVGWTWKYGIEYYTAWDNSKVRDFLKTTFYSHFSPKFKNAIVEVEIPYIDKKRNMQTIKDNLFLLSIAEWGLAKDLDPNNQGKYAQEGSPIMYSDLRNTYAASTMQGYTCTWLDKNIYNLFDDNGTPYYPTRTIFKNSVGYGAGTFGVNGNGYVKGSDVPHTRPAVNIKSSTVVKGPYELKYYSHCGANAKTRKVYEIVE